MKLQELVDNLVEIRRKHPEMASPNSELAERGAVTASDFHNLRQPPIFGEVVLDKEGNVQGAKLNIKIF